MSEIVFRCRFDYGEQFSEEDLATGVLVSANGVIQAAERFADEHASPGSESEHVIVYWDRPDLDCWYRVKVKLGFSAEHAQSTTREELLKP